MNKNEIDNQLLIKKHLTQEEKDLFFNLLDIVFNKLSKINQENNINLIEKD
jgi:hypothetical protein